MITTLSFCILNYGHSDGSLKRCIESINIQRVPEYEIMVCGIEGGDDGIKYFHKEDWAKRGEINKMRNYLCDQATKEFIVLIDTGIELASDWYSNIKQADCFDLIGSRLLNPDGKRVIDWAYQSRMTNQNLPIPLQYDEWTTMAYISGILMILRRSVWERVKFNENLLLDQNDDVDFCLLASEIGLRVGVFPKAMATYYHYHNTCTFRKYVTFDEPLKIVGVLRNTFNKGEAEYASCNYNQAIKYYQKVLEITPKWGLVWEKIGWAHYFMTRPSEAIKAFDEALMLDPDSNFALTGRGWTHFKKGNYEDAVQDLSKVAEYIHPTEKDAWQEALRGQGWSYYQNRSFNKAIESFNKALENIDSSNKELRKEVFLGRHLACQKLIDCGNIVVQQLEPFSVDKQIPLWKLVSLVKQTLREVSKKFKVNYKHVGKGELFYKLWKSCLKIVFRGTL